MADFSNGVSGYVKGEARVTVNFPIDFKGNADVSCSQCPFFSRNGKYCQINKAMCAYPEKYIGQNCPLEFKEDNNGDQKT